MNKALLFRRYILFVISLFFIGLGIALTKHGGLGVSPISAVANVVSLRFPVFTFGTWLTGCYCLFLLVQVLLLRKKFALIHLLQLPASFLTGYFADFGLQLAQNFPCKTYPAQLLFVLLGSIVLAFGITLSILANVILNPGEAIVKAIADTAHKAFETTKTVFDVCWVILAAVLSLLFFDGKLVGVREGTVLSALLVGLFIKIMRPPLRGLCEKAFTVRKE